MTDTTATTGTVAPRRAVEADRHKTTFARVVRSEWSKLWSVRSTTWTLLLLVTITIGFSALFSWGTTSSLDFFSDEELAQLDPTNVSLSGMLFGQLICAVLGTLVITSEYSTGGIRTSLAAVPQRLKLLFAKAVVVLVVILFFGTVTSFGAFFVGQLFFESVDLADSLGDPNVLRAVFGAGLYLGGCAMFGLAVGALLRSTPASITSVIAALFVLPLLSNALPGEWGRTIMKYFTQNAGSQIATTTTLPDMLTPWVGFGVFNLEWLVVLVVACVLLVRRDA